MAIVMIDLQEVMMIEVQVVQMELGREIEMILEETITVEEKEETDMTEETEVQKEKGEASDRKPMSSHYLLHDLFRPKLNLAPRTKPVEYAFIQSVYCACY